MSLRTEAEGAGATRGDPSRSTAKAYWNRTNTAGCLLKPLVATSHELGMLHGQPHSHRWEDVRLIPRKHQPHPNSTLKFVTLEAMTNSIPPYRMAPLEPRSRLKWMEWATGWQVTSAGLKSVVPSLKGMKPSVLATVFLTVFPLFEGPCESYSECAWSRFTVFKY